MHVYRKSTGVAIAIAAVMVLGALSGVLVGSLHSPAATASAPAPAAATASSPALSHAPGTDSLTTGGASITTQTSTGTPTLPAAPTAPADPLASTAATPSGRMAATVSTLRSDGVPLRDAFLPNLNANPHPTLSKYGTVTPEYTTGPAPLGVAEYGVINFNGTLYPFNLNTTTLVGTFTGYNYACELVGNCTPSVLAMDSGAPDSYGLQMNAVLENVTLFNTPGYDFWTQNVFEYSTYSDELYIITNIWNFSAPGAGFTANALAGHGANGTIVPGELYYSVSGPYKISSDYSAEVWLNSEVVGNDDAVLFEFDVGNGTVFYSGVNDYAIFNSTGAVGPGVSAPAQYVASGSQYTPLGLPADWEFVMGGPGGGSNLDVFSMYSQMNLYYWDWITQSYEVVPSAYDVGSETGETTYGATALWEGDWAGYDSPGEWITPGPTMEYGMWNVTNYTQGYGILGYALDPPNAFTFFGQTGNPYNWTAYAWAPSQFIYFLPSGFYSVWSLASNFLPEYNFIAVGNGSEQLVTVDLQYDPVAGVYTPLWALNQTDLDYITWNGYDLFTDSYGPIGYDQVNGITFPWFGVFNDYTYPVFPGILLWHVVDAGIIAPPSMLVNFPSWYSDYLDYYGLPTYNDLQILVYDSYGITLAGASSISGWWFTAADFGPTAPQYNVVFWNSSFSKIEGNHFNTGSSALYLYGGTDNGIYNNTFEELLPNAPNLLSIAGYYFGTYGLFEADYGDYVFYGEICDCWDVIFNNIFDTYFTAYSPYYDPYTGHTPIVPFSEEWNIDRENGPINIIGGDYLGGNYWWNYGTLDNPYGVLPYDNLNWYYYFLWDLYPVGIYFGGDFVPLIPTPVYTVTFVEVGLPVGTEWSPEVEIIGGWETNYTDADYANLSLIEGDYNVSAYSANPHFAYVGGASIYVNGSETFFLEFSPDYTLSFEETGLPAGTEWEVYVAGSDYFNFNLSNGEWVNFSAPVGAYEYEAEAFGYYGSPESFGFTNVSGNETVVIPFLPVYFVEFNETGLAAGQNWTIIVQSVGHGNGTFSTTVTGTSEFLGYAYAGYEYNWWVVAPGFVATPASGTVVISENQTIDVSFAASESVTFDESGLAPGTAWTVELTQGSSTTSETSTGTSITFSAEAGAFSYTVSAAGYVPGASSGTGTLPVSGPIDVTFTPAPATIVFDESGLPVGTSWTVEFTQNSVTTDHSGTGTSISIDAVDGAYSYTVSAADFTAAPASGSGLLPSDTPVAISFSATPATIDFEETGLAAGTGWTVAFTQNDVTTDYSGTGATIAIGAVEGPYSYTVKAANYSASSPSGSGTLPADATVSETFSVVDGTLAGTVAPTSATLTVDAVAQTVGAGGTFSVSLAPGTYAVKVAASGYYSYYTNVTVAAGKTTELNVKLTAIPSTPKPASGISGTNSWLLVAGLGLLVLILLGTTLYFLNRSRRPPQMTQYTGAAAPAGATEGTPAWSETEEGTPPSGKS